MSNLSRQSTFTHTPVFIERITYHKVRELDSCGCCFLLSKPACEHTATNTHNID